MQKPLLIPNATFRNDKRSHQTFLPSCRLFMGLVYLTRVLLVAGNDCPVLKLNPQRVVVRYGSSVSVNCSTEVTPEGIGWEASQNSVPMIEDKLVTWSVSNLTEWEIEPQCFINYDSDQCEVYLSITVYKTPDSVSISPVDHTGPMIEGFRYQLQCDIENVAPGNLTVKWYKGETLVHHETFNDTIKTPVNKTSRHTITPNRTDDGVQYRCEAELDLGADGPQPPKVKSEPINITVHYIFINHTGPMIESYTYKLQCHIPNVVRVKMVSVNWYKQQRPLPQETITDSSSTELTITPNRTDDGAQYSCTAVLNDGSQLPSQPLDITVYYKPVINKVKLPSKVPVFRGYSVVLVCEAEGNPKPTISWSPIANAEQVIDGNLTITEATSQNLICNATNDVGSTHRNVTVVLKEDYLPLIAGLVAVTVAVISVIFVFIYSIYYKTAKMGHYSLKDAKPSEQNGNIGQNGKVNPLPMKKFSQSDIFA